MADPREEERQHRHQMAHDDSANEVPVFFSIPRKVEIPATECETTKMIKETLGQYNDFKQLISATSDQTRCLIGVPSVPSTPTTPREAPTFSQTPSSTSKRGGAHQRAEEMWERKLQQDNTPAATTPALQLAAPSGGGRRREKPRHVKSPPLPPQQHQPEHPARQDSGHGKQHSTKYVKHNAHTENSSHPQNFEKTSQHQILQDKTLQHQKVPEKTLPQKLSEKTVQHQKVPEKMLHQKLAEKLGDKASHHQHPPGLSHTSQGNVEKISNDKIPGKTTTKAFGGLTDIIDRIAKDTTAAKLAGNQDQAGSSSKDNKQLVREREGQEHGKSGKDQGKRSDTWLPSGGDVRVKDQSVR